MAIELELHVVKKSIIKNVLIRFLVKPSRSGVVAQIIDVSNYIICMALYPFINRKENVYFATSVNNSYTLTAANSNLSSRHKWHFNQEH